MTILKPAFAYFLIVFGAGFVLGILRTLFLVPRLGDRTAELLEMPFMLAVVFFAARFTVKKWGRTRRAALAFGLGALLMLFLVEVGMSIVLLFGTDETTRETYEGPDPVSGTAFAISLLIFGLLPCLMFPRWRKS